MVSVRRGLPPGVVPFVMHLSRWVNSPFEEANRWSDLNPKTASEIRIRIDTTWSNMAKDLMTWEVELVR